MQMARIGCLCRSLACLSVLFVLACHSGGGSRDAALAADVPAQADRGAPDGQPDTVVATADSAVPSDRQPDAVLLNSPTDRGIDLAQADDAGSDGVTTFRCDFPLVNPQVLFCDRGQYCHAIGGGAVGSGTTFSCAVPPPACAGNPTCECLCGSGGVANCSDPAHPGIHCICASDRQGPVLLCSAP
jgi:hypothetical protein